MIKGFKNVVSILCLSSGVEPLCFLYCNFQVLLRVCSIYLYNELVLWKVFVFEVYQFSLVRIRNGVEIFPTSFRCLA